MDVMFEQYYAFINRREGVTFEACPREMIPILEMIVVISVCNEEKEKLKKIKAVLRANYEFLNITDEQGETCLHFAVRMDDCDIDVIRELLKHGADPNKSNIKGDSPLHINARICCASDIMRTLLKHGGDYNSQNNSGDTALHIAARNSHSLETVKVLLEFGANVGSTNFILRNVLHTALENKYCDLSLVKKCLKNQPSLVNSCDLRNITPLHLAVLDCQNKIKVVKELLKCGADVNARDIAGRTPMHWILYFSDVDEFDIIKAFLDKGADINARDLIDRTPLFYAVRTRSHITAKQLIRHGAEINTFDLMRKSVLNEAVNGFELGEKVKTFQGEAAELFKQEIVKTFHNTEMFRPLLNSIFRHSTVVQLINLKSNDGKIVINSHQQMEVIKLLLENDANPDFGNLEYRLLPFDSQAPCADKLLVQYRVMKNFAKTVGSGSVRNISFASIVQAITTFDIEIFEEEFREEWLCFRDECIFEVLKMRKEKLSRRYTLYKFVADRCSRVKVPQITSPAIIDKFLFILNSNKYPCCKDIMLASIKRNDLVERLFQLKIYTQSDNSEPDRDKIVVLNSHTIGYIVKYLSKKDLINLILAFISKSTLVQRKDSSRNMSPRSKRKVETENDLISNAKRLKVVLTKL